MLEKLGFAMPRGSDGDLRRPGDSPKYGFTYYMHLFRFSVGFHRDDPDFDRDYPDFHRDYPDVYRDDRTLSPQNRHSLR